MSGRRITFGIGGTLLATIVVAFALLIGHLHATANASGAQSDYGCSNLPAGYANTSLGNPAITPHLTGDITFTTQDVQAYLTKTLASPGNPVTFQRVEFMSSLQACRLLRGVASGLDLNAMVCYAAFTFTYQGQMMKNYSIFDAKTGKLLVGGGQPGPSK